MNSNENKLSSYIDSLNEERKPGEHGSEMESSEMEELFNTVRMVKSLKEPNLPDKKYSERLGERLKSELLETKALRKKRKRWFYGMASAAAAVAVVITLNMIAPFGKTNIVYAMEQAFKEVKAYHGVIEVIETNAEGKSTRQSKIEVWADKSGRYYSKALEGAQKGLVTANDGRKKWQIQPQEKEVDLFAAFPDPYSFTFEIGREITDVKSASETRVAGEDNIAGRASVIIEVTPKGGNSYRIWIDKETKMPLQKESAMEYSIQYKVCYTSIDFSESVPEELLVYNVPKGYKETASNPEQIVNSLEEANALAGFVPSMPKDIPASFVQGDMTVNSSKVSKINYASKDSRKKILVLQKRISGGFKTSSNAVLGKINDNDAEIQSPVQEEAGVLQAMGAYAGSAGITSVRWQQGGFEFAVLGNVAIEDLTQFVKELADGAVELAGTVEQPAAGSQVQVPVNLEAEKGDQKNADAGHSPWKLDPVFVSQVFVSLKLSPEGIQGDYPIKYEELKIVKNDGKEAVVEVGGSKTPISRVYLKRLVRQDNTGIWTVVGYDRAK